ncbi:glycoprotein L [Cercopithecine alphaherpesvirus 9]|uniref:Glycoprotein L n=2 Tax=Cercopithecine alphaherpesvirus 9 TaxID=35246 RepID=A0A2D0TCL1_CHV9D|nr:envelope glycoprotein L [Cercopithecine alphaherpesvirus 9]AAD41747.1 glycoprotein L [Cercopithecine alphaherpesvirus 9]AAG27236.1 glycoprotein L [Cercopithecine alphaherpesvirus 9]
MEGHRFVLQMVLFFWLYKTHGLYIENDDIFLGSKYISDVSSIITEPCISFQENLWKYSAPSVPNLKEDISGFVLKSSCPIPELIIWFKNKHMAYWVNPYVMLHGLVNTIYIEESEDDMRGVLVERLSTALQSRGDISTDPPDIGCVFGAQNVFQRLCLSEKGIWQRGVVQQIQKM